MVNRLFSDADRRAAAARALRRRPPGSGVATVHELGGPHLGPRRGPGPGTRGRRRARAWTSSRYWGELATPASIDPGARGGVARAGRRPVHRRRDRFPDGRADRAVRRRTPHTGARAISATTRSPTTSSRAPAPGCRPASTASATTRSRPRSRACGGPPQTLGAEPRSARARHRLEHVEMVAAARPRDPGRARRGGQRAAGVRRRVGRPGRAVRATARPGPGAADEPVRHAAPRRRACSPSAPTRRSPRSRAGPWSGTPSGTARPEERLSTEAAFAAATGGGHRAAGVDGAGVLATGAPASLAIWDLVGGPTGPSGLPALEAGDPLPTCVGTIANGKFAYLSPELVEGDRPPRPGRPESDPDLGPRARGSRLTGSLPRLLQPGARRSWSGSGLQSGPRAHFGLGSFGM